MYAILILGGLFCLIFGIVQRIRKKISTGKMFLFIAAWFFLSLIGGAIAPSNTNNNFTATSQSHNIVSSTDTNKTKEQQNIQQKPTENNKVNNTSETAQITGKLSDIKVSYEIDNTAFNTKGQFKTTIHIQNTSRDSFSGTVAIYSKDTNGHTLGSDYIVAGTDDKPLFPGQSVMAVSWLKKGITPKLEYDITGKFIPYTGHKSNVKYVINKATIGPGAGVIWVVLPNTKKETVIDVSKEFIDKYKKLPSLIVYYYDNAAKINDPNSLYFAELNWNVNSGEKPYIQYSDSMDKIPIQ